MGNCIESNETIMLKGQRTKALTKFGQAVCQNLKMCNPTVIQKSKLLGEGHNWKENADTIL